VAQPHLERVGVDEVRERSLAVDLDHGKKLAVARLENRVAVDLHDVELEAERFLCLAHDLERRPAEPAPLGAVDDDPGYGYRPLVVVASATRWTARPYEAMRRVVSNRSRVSHASWNARAQMSRSFAFTSSSCQKYS
jgi:hypothetical protein